MVHAFEAQRHLLTLLTANLALNNRKGVAPHTVVPHNRPVGGTPGQLVRIPTVDYDHRSNFAEVTLTPVDVGVGAGVGACSRRW